jgi:predicted ATP-binding protein involved in virulence
MPNFHSLSILPEAIDQTDMRIAALFIESHAFIKYDFTTVNLGSEYIYELVRTGEEISISRAVNPQFISGFYDVSGSKISIQNVSAIVGQNGVGKSTLLDVVRRGFINHTNALPRVKCLLLFENWNVKEQKVEIFYHSLDYDIVKFGRKKISKIKKDTVQTIYYSPHLDLKYDRNFDEVDYFDLSLDRYIELDLVDIDAMDKNDHGVSFSVKQELLFKNSVRQIKFLTSPIVVDDQRFKGLFNFPVHGEATLFLRGLLTDKAPRNVPYVLREPLEKLDSKIIGELDAHHKVRKRDQKNKSVNEAEVQGYLLKRNLIRHLISLLFRQMDRSNDYLSSVKFDSEEFEKSLTESAYIAFLSFLTSTSIPTPKGKENPFDVQAIAALFDKIYSVVDNTKEKNRIEQNELTCSPSDAIEILDLHKAVVYDISDYYNKQMVDAKDRFDALNYLVPDFIYYAPANKRLSSGENALINFYSKIYDFLEVKLDTRRNKKPAINSFVMLLDEADMGFHPVWKKRFVKAMISTLPFFFEKYDQNPSLQIIFTTHDPLTLSDLLSTNVVCLKNIDGKVGILESFDSLKTFGANITDLLANSFFVDDGLIGDFARDKIHETISWLNKESQENAGVYRKIISNIDEPIVKRKLAEMYDRKMEGSLELSIVNRQIEELQKLRNKLQDDQNSHN